MFGAQLGFCGNMRSCCRPDVGRCCQGISGGKRRRGDRGDCYGGFDPRGRSLNHGGQRGGLGRSAARFDSLEEKIGLTSKDNGLTFRQDPKALPGDIAGRSVAFDGVVPITGRGPEVTLVGTIKSGPLLAVPVVAVLLAVKVSVLVEVVGFVLNVAVTPLGKPDAASVTLPENPPMSVTVIVLVPLPP